MAEIIGISNHTVDAHLRRIYLKLGVFDRIERCCPRDRDRPDPWPELERDEDRRSPVGD